MTFNNTQDSWRQVLLSILVGACVAFLSSMVEGLADALAGFGNNVAGGTASSVALLVSRIRL